MSQTQTQTQNPVQTFAEPSNRKLPTLGCVGRVTEVGDVVVSKSEKYLVLPISIEPFGAGKKQTAYPCFRPEWLRAGFDPDTALYDPETAEELSEGGKSAHFVYEKNIRAPRGASSVSTLRGLAGSDAAFDTLANALLTIPSGDLETEEALTKFIGDLTKTFKSFFRNNKGPDGQPRKFIYILVQQKTDTGEVEPILDEAGNDTGRTRKIYVLENRYEISNFLDFTQKNVDKMIARAKKNEVKNPFKWTYANEPF